MNTETVLKIIAMLEREAERIYWTDMKESSLNPDPVFPNAYYEHVGAMKALSDFADHLQEYIESQVDQVENEMNRGE